ncbi:MAG: immunoglobulin domain-containing protein, partial [Melioribacteraceae bacterium]
RYTDPFYLTNSATLKIRGFKNGYSPSNSASVNFTILNSAIAQITKHPISQSPIVGSAVKLYVKYTGTPKPQVQWQFNNVNISGATSDTLILNNVKLNESGNYRAIVSNASGAVTSNDGILNVLETPVPPVILVQPIDLIANEGDSTTFSIVTSGIPKPTYLWFRNGSPLNAQIGDRLTFANTNLSHVGDYQVQVSNSAGLLLSDQVMLTVNLATGVSSEGSEIPNKFELFQNYPNPFNPTTTISFAIAKLTDVKVSLYDILGREIAILVEETLPAGNYKTIFDATGLASGTYFYRMETKEYVMTKKILFIK